MQLMSLKMMFAASWLVLIAGAGLAAEVQSPTRWIMLAVVAVMMPTVMMWRWREPVRSMSQNIQDALRRR